MDCWNTTEEFFMQTRNDSRYLRYKALRSLALSSSNERSLWKMGDDKIWTITCRGRKRYLHISGSSDLKTRGSTSSKFVFEYDRLQQGIVLKDKKTGKCVGFASNGQRIRMVERRNAISWERISHDGKAL